MGPEISQDLATARIASRQHGNVTYRQLMELGLSDKAIARRIRTGRLFRVHTGVYSVGRPPTTALEKASAAVLACGPGAGLSHRSAFCLWGFTDHWHSPPFDVIVVRDRRPKGIKTHRARGLTRKDFRSLHGIRATSPARTILDRAPALPEKTLRRAINDALRSELLRPAALADTVARFPLHPGSKLLRPIIEDTDDGITDSTFEDDFLAFCTRHALPRPQTGVYVAGHRVDALFRDAKLIIECDGWDFHNTRDSFESDRDRDADTLAAGHATVRITKRRINTTPDHEARRLHEILAARTANR